MTTVNKPQRRFIGLSIHLESDVLSDPPPLDIARALAIIDGDGSDGR